MGARLRRLVEVREAKSKELKGDDEQEMYNEQRARSAEHKRGKSSNYPREGRGASASQTPCSRHERCAAMEAYMMYRRICLGMTESMTGTRC